MFGGSSLELSLDGGGGGDGEGEGDRNSGEKIVFVRRMHRGAGRRWIISLRPIYRNPKNRAREEEEVDQNDQI